MMCSKGAKRASEAARAVKLARGVEKALKKGRNSSLLPVEVPEVEVAEEY
jgi:hypothetical protein